MSLVAGTRLGPYEIQSAIGAGGTGEIYKAHDTRLDRSVAIKVRVVQAGNRLPLALEARTAFSVGADIRRDVFQAKTARGVAWLHQQTKAGAWREGAFWVEGMDLGLRLMLLAIDGGLQVRQRRPRKTGSGEWVQ